jgi:hypothetical protein
VTILHRDGTDTDLDRDSSRACDRLLTGVGLSMEYTLPPTRLGGGTNAGNDDGSTMLFKFSCDPCT